MNIFVHNIGASEAKMLLEYNSSSLIKDLLLDFINSRSGQPQCNFCLPRIKVRLEKESTDNVDNDSHAARYLLDNVR